MTADRLKKRLAALEGRGSKREGLVCFLGRVGETQEETMARLDVECPGGADFVVILRPGDEKI